MTATRTLSLSARIARADAIRRAVRVAALPLAAGGTVALAVWGLSRTLERRDAVATAAAGYCTEAATLGAGDSLEGLREGMLLGNDTDGVVYRAALAGFRAQCAAQVAKIGGR